MSENRQKLIHLRSSVVKVPQASDLNYGEIAVQYAKTSPILYIKNTDNEIVKFIDSGAIVTILGSYVTNDSLTANYATSANTHSAINAIAQKLVNVYTYKGSVAAYENLPSENLTIGDVYNVEAAHGNIPPGTNYAWNGTTWDSLGGSVDLSNYATTGDVNTISGAVDTLTSRVDDLEVSAHTHENITVLNGITSEKVADWDEAAASAHTHSNKSLLDTYQQTESDLADAVEKKHSHSNADVLDGISSEDVSAWNAKQDAISDLTTIRNNASSGATAYSTVTTHTADTTIHVTTAQTAAWDAKQNALSNEDVLSGITSQQVTNWDNAATNSHTHDNMSVLSGITSQDVAGWDEAAASAHTHANSGVLDGITSTKVDQWDSAYTISQEALIGIETGKENGASVNANNELDFSGLYIDCGEY